VWGLGTKELVVHHKKVQAFGRCSGRGSGAGAGAENLFEFDGGESTLADFDESSDQIPNHSIEETISVKGQFQNTALFFDDPNGADRSSRRLALVPRVGSKRSKVVFPGENLGGFAQRGEIKGTWDVPSPTNFEGMKGVGVGNPVKVGLSFCGESGVKSGFFTSDGEDSDPCREMKVEGLRESGGRMKGGDFAGGNLTEGVHAPIGSAGSCNGDWAVKDFLKGFLEGELDGGIGILTLPTEEVFSAVGEKETVRNRLHPKINGGRLRAKDYRSSR